MAEDKISVTNFLLDLDVDSDNNNGYDSPDFSDAEDKIEMDDPGKIIGVDSGDRDGDGILDYCDYEIKSDGFNKNVFAEVKLRIDGPIPENARVKLQYNDSAPPAKEGGKLANGTLRLWKKQSREIRNPKSTKNGGDFYAASTNDKKTWYTLKELFGKEKELTLYLEAVRMSKDVNNPMELVTVNIIQPDKSNAEYELVDQVKVMPLEIDMDVKYPVAYTGDLVKEEDEFNPGIFLMVNDDHDGKLNNFMPDNSDDKINGADDKKDMAELILRKIPGLLPDGGKIFISKKSGTGQLRIFENDTTVLLDTSASAQIPDSKAKALFTALKTDKLSYFTEGLEPGELTLAMEYVTGGGSVVGSDEIKITVGKIELEPVTIEGGTPPNNPCGIEKGKTAKFAVKVEPASISDSKIEWTVKSGKISFDGSNKGRLVTVRGNGTGKAKLEVSIPAHKGPKPQISLEVLDKKTVNAFIYIVQSNDGNTNATTEQNVRNLLSQVNEIYKQVAIEFNIQSIGYIQKHADDPQNPDDWLDISTANDWAELSQLTSTHQHTGGIELYFIDTINGGTEIVGVNIGPGYGAEDGMALTDVADFRAVAHEIGHAGTLNDIYITKRGKTLSDDLVKEPWLKNDWNNGPSPQYYNSSLKQKVLIPRLLMYGDTSGIEMDISSGKIHGIDVNGIETDVKVGDIKTPQHN